MNEIEREDAHRDLGYLSKKEVTEDDTGEVRRALNARVEREKILNTDWRQKNFTALQSLDPALVDEGQSMVVLTIRGRRIEFHLSSNTWFSYAKQQYGYGIEAQVEKIAKFLKGTEWLNA